ncbi:MAG: acyl-CoA dehydrogenase family protein [Acidobacteriota bacterium]
MTTATLDDPVTTLDFRFDEEQLLLRDEVRRFAVERIQPGEAERDRAHHFPEDIFAELGELGLLGMMVPEAYGGVEMSPLTYCLAVEELARVSPSVAVTMSVTNSVCCWPIVHFGSEELKARVLPELAGGALGGFGLTEPEAGSDVGNMRTRAVRDGDDWLLSGEKAWITNAGIGRYFVVLARTDPDGRGSRGISAFVVPADAPGLSIGQTEEKMGLRASVTAQLFFDECRIPAANLLGEEGQGFRIALATLDHSRLGIAAQAVGIHQRALELAVDYARERVQFGVPIARHQTIQFKIAQMATDLAASRVLTYHGAMAEEGTATAGRLASQAKLYASEAANRACWESLQIHGGNGFSEEYEIARLYRDVRVTTIYEGTSEMQRIVIARHLLRG